MRKVIVALLLIVSFVGFSGLATAGTLHTLHFVSNSSYYSPYVFKIDNHSSTTLLVCASEWNHINPPKDWTVMALDIEGVDGVWGIGEDTWNQAAWLTAKLMAKPNDPDIQNQLWHVMGFGGKDISWLDAQWSHVTGFETTATFYIPVDSNGHITGWSSSYAQPFIGAPEPASLALLGSGLIGLLGFYRKR